MNDRVNLLTKFKDKLAPVLENSELPRQISLKQCFRSPSFIAMTHKMLSNCDITSLQVGFGMFVSIVKNGEIYSPQSFSSPNPITVNGQSLNEVISKLDEVGDKLNEVIVLTIQIQLEDKKKTSILQLVQENKQLGKLAIEKTGLTISFDSPEEEKYKKLIQEKKAKAALFKQRLMKEYQNKQKQFGTSEQALKVENKQKQRQQKQQQQQQQEKEQQANDDDDFVNNSNQGFNNTEIICNVCLTEQDDILGFPCLSIR